MTSVIMNTKRFFTKRPKAEMLYSNELSGDKINTIEKLGNMNTVSAFKKSRMAEESVKSFKVNNTELVYPSEIFSAFNSYVCCIE
jgi:hypothetical protein